MRLSQEIVSAVSNITKDFQIGFGSFVDKEVMPFISLAPNDNCQTENCPPPYSFQHQMKLARDSNLFTERVSKANISGIVVITFIQILFLGAFTYDVMASEGGGGLPKGDTST